MLLKDESFDSVSQEATKHHLELTALIQDIQQCVGPMEYLHELNAEGRVKIAALRANIEQLEGLAECERDMRRRAELSAAIENYKGQLSTALAAFRKANVTSANTIEERSRNELFAVSDEQESTMRRRKDRNVASESSRLTEKLMDLSKHLAESTQWSAETLDTLVISSEKVTGTSKELENQQQIFVQSGKLLGKYHRREITDKVLLTLAFMFFLACIFYILQKRLF